MGDVLRLKLVLFDGSSKTVEAEVRNVVPPSNEEENGRFGCLFHGLSKKDKHDMLKETMLSQRELLRLIIERQVEL